MLQSSDCDVDLCSYIAAAYDGLFRLNFPSVLRDLSTISKNMRFGDLLYYLQVQDSKTLVWDAKTLRLAKNLPRVIIFQGPFHICIPNTVSLKTTSPGF